MYEARLEADIEDTVPAEVAQRRNLLKLRQAYMLPDGTTFAVIHACIHHF